MDTKIRNAILISFFIIDVNLVLGYLYFTHFIYIKSFSWFGLLFALTGAAAFYLYKNLSVETKSDKRVTAIFIANMFIDVSLFVMYLFFSFKLV